MLFSVFQEVYIVADIVSDGNTLPYVGGIAQNRNGEIPFLVYCRRDEIADFGIVADACQNAPRLGIVLYLAVESLVLGTDVNKKCTVEVGRLVLFLYAYERQFVKPFIEFWRDNYGFAYKTMQNRCLVKSNLSAAYYEDALARYIQSYW